MDKCLDLRRLGDIWLNKLIQNVVEAGRTISYVKTLGNKADTLHITIKNSYKRLFMHEFEKFVRFAIANPGLKNKKVKIALDTTEDLTWCKNNYNLGLQPMNTLF